MALTETPATVAASADTETVDRAYGLVRRIGEASLDSLGVSVGVLRRRAAKDGLRVSQWTITDYMGRKTRRVAVVDARGEIAYAVPAE